MKNIKIELVDNDHVVRAKMELPVDGNDEPLRMFLREINEELIPGEIAHLEIEGFKKDPLIFEISPCE